MQIKYRKEIDGLRAIAVISVVFFHADFNLFSGGFVGVDVFFVISGYLITALILNDLKNNSFSFKYFFKLLIEKLFSFLKFTEFNIKSKLPSENSFFLIF